jgi:hypothetical protein
MIDNQNPWFPLVALMMLPAMGGINDSRIRALLDTVTQNDDGSFNTEQFVNGMMELLKEETESLTIEEAINKLKEQNTYSEQ